MRTRPVLSPSALAVCLVVGCGGGGDEVSESPPPESATVATEADNGDSRDSESAAEVEAFLGSYYRALSDRDWDRFASHFWPGASLTTIWIPPGELSERVVYITVPEFVARAPEGPDSREIFEERMTSVEVVESNGLAQAWATYDARFGDPGDIVEWTGTDAFTLLRHEAEWRIVSVAYAPDAN